MRRESGLLAHFLDILLRRRYYVAACFTAVMLGTLLVTLLTKPVYRARSVVQIEQPAGYVLRTEVLGIGLTRTEPQEQAEMVRTYPYKQLVDSIVVTARFKGINLSQYYSLEDIRRLFEEVLCPEPGSADVERCIQHEAARLEARPIGSLKQEEDFAQQVVARLVEDTGLIELFAEADDPQRAQDAANAAALAIAWQNERLRKEEARNTARFIRQQLEAPDGVKQQLEQTDQRLAEFKRSKQFLDAGEQIRALMLQFVDLTNKRWQGLLRLTELRSRLAKNEQQLQQEPSTIVSPTIYENPNIQEIKKQLVAAEAELLSLQAVFTDEHPRVQAALAKVQSLRQNLQQEATRLESVQRLPNPVHQELYKNLALLAADIVGQEAQLAAIEATLETVQRQMASVPDLELQLTQLLRQRQALERRYLFLIERLQEAELTQAVKLGNARVVELAPLPGKRVKPRRVLNLLMGAILGVFLAAGLALLLEQVDRRLPAAPIAAEWLRTPLIHTVPVVKDGASSEPIGETFRQLRAALRVNTLERPARVILVTSALPREGKSFIVRHLAASVAQAGQRVVIVDADLRQPSQHRFDPSPVAPGLSEVLEERIEVGDCLYATSVNNLWLLPAGTASSQAIDLLEGERMRSLLQGLRQQFDAVFVDSVPAGLSAQVPLLALHCDAVLMVVQPGVTLRDAAERAVQSLRALPQVHLLGIVANRVSSSNNHIISYSVILEEKQQ